MNRATQFIELSESSIGQRVHQQVQLERSKFRHAQTKPTLNHALKVIRELDNVKGYRPDQNVVQRPTIGMDSEYDRYDPNPMARWNPELRKQVEAGKNSRAGKLLKKKNGSVLDPETGAPIDPETGELIGNEDDEVPSQPKKQIYPNNDPNQQQQEPAQAQQSNDPQSQQDLSPDAGQQQAELPNEPPEKPELPVDQRKDPTWKGNQASPKPQGVEDSSQRVVSRYDKEMDPMRKSVMPTSSYLLRQNRRNPQSHSKGNGFSRRGPMKYWS